jgi:hypothetical protein
MARLSVVPAQITPKKSDSLPPPQPPTPLLLLLMLLLILINEVKN